MLDQAWERQAAAELSLILRGVCSEGFDNPENLQARLIEYAYLLGEPPIIDTTTRQIVHHHGKAVRWLAAQLAGYSYSKDQRTWLVLAFQEALKAWDRQPPETLAAELKQNLNALQIARNNLAAGQLIQLEDEVEVYTFSNNRAFIERRLNAWATSHQTNPLAVDILSVLEDLKAIRLDIAHSQAQNQSSPPDES
jgi:RecB family endonuclease NucS